MTEIKGWGLQPPKESDSLWFSYEVLGEPEGCTISCCAHVTHDPAAPWAAWIPCAGVKILGVVCGPRSTIDYVEKYFAAVRGSEARFYRYTRPYRFWAKIEPVGPGDVPASVWGRFLLDRSDKSD